MDDRTQTLLDHTYLRPGIVSRAGAIGLAAVGVGTGVLLACYGASFFFNTNNKRLDALTAKVEELAQRPDRSDAVIAKLDDLKSNAEEIGGSVTTRLASIEESLEELKHRPIITGNPDQHEKTVNGNVIEREVTVFHTVTHDNGNVITGWKYPDGASADQRPKFQYCFWLGNYFGGTTSQSKIDIAIDGAPLANIGVGVPRLAEALQKCVWWNGSTTN